ncbi:MAG: hypothetical protein MUO80_07550 [Dehalococcoidia bacterium]|nr:hypothetical protein [Dehalococcoidia bacterium]
MSGFYFSDASGPSTIVAGAVPWLKGVACHVAWNVVTVVAAEGNPGRPCDVDSWMLRG